MSISKNENVEILKAEVKIDAFMQKEAFQFFNKAVQL